MTTADPRTPNLWPFYVGALLGPFGGAMVNAILPEVAAGVGTNEAGVALALTAYMIPFSGLMVLSGTLGTRWGLTRTIRWAYGLYAAASIGCALANALVPFLAARALQGVANAFTTPLLVAVISQLIPRERLGRALGVYASMQAAGQAFAPLVGGLVAEWDYRLGFAANALAAVVLAMWTPTVAAGVRREANWAALRNPRLARSAATAFCSQFTQTAVMVLAALVAADRFGLSASARGLLVAAFGLAGLVTGRAVGVLTERYGLVRVGVGALAVLGAAMAAIGVAPWVGLLVVLVAAAGVSGTAGRILTNGLAIASTPANVGGATSVTMSAQFVGVALVPTLIPLYHASGAVACLLAGTVAWVGAAIASRARVPA